MNFHWQPNGPIEQFFRREVQRQFFDSAFDTPDSVRVVKSGDIAQATFRQIATRLQSTAQLFDDMARENHAYTSDQRLGTSMILVIRHWEFGAFKVMERKG